ncbi:hypothetical protein [Microbispora sp. GKU 823]|uniref:hypothetical protein n=1 Tax=Microbispora sp. GKU 823 TaxID=1652100 RepID=UPI0021181B90|nr:hypothetical protein [Microbispora sp. GKU 823]
MTTSDEFTAISEPQTQAMRADLEEQLQWREVQLRDLRAAVDGATTTPPGSPCSPTSPPPSGRSPSCARRWSGSRRAATAGAPTAPRSSRSAG